MSFSFTMQAEPGTRFTADAFANQIGHRTTVRAGERTTEAVVLGAKVAPDGGSAELTVDVDLTEFAPELTAIDPGSFSFTAT